MRCLESPPMIDFLKVRPTNQLLFSKDFSIYIGCYSRTISMLLQRCLDKDPEKRWTCERLLSHPLFDEYLAKRKDAPDYVDSYKPNRIREKIISKVTSDFEYLKTKTCDYTQYFSFQSSNTSLPILVNTQENGTNYRSNAKMFSTQPTEHHLPSI